MKASVLVRICFLRRFLCSGYSVEFAQRLSGPVYQDSVQRLSLAPAEQQEMDGLRAGVVSSAGRVQEEHQRLSTKVSSCVVGALVTLSCLPAKLNPLIRPLMDCIKTDEDTLMQVPDDPLNKTITYPYVHPDDLRPWLFSANTPYPFKMPTYYMLKALHPPNKTMSFLCGLPLAH